MNYLMVDKLGVTYPDGTVALHSVSFTAERGEIIAIIGCSGSGKSTLLRCINGLQRSSSGAVYINGENLIELNETQCCDYRSKIGFIWQEHNLVGRFSTLKNVLTGRLGQYPSWCCAVGYFDRSQRELALHNLERVKLLHRARLRADRLSGGEKQRVTIARALTQEPEMILADEPVASLDPELALDVLNQLTYCCREDGVLTLVSLHHVEFAKQIADRVIALADGQLLFDGPPATLDDDMLNALYKGLPLATKPKPSHPPQDLDYAAVIS